MHNLSKFAFWWRNLSGGSLVVRGEVFPWDGLKAVGGPLYESQPRTISFGDTAFHEESFEPVVLAVAPGAQYVLFASIDKDYEQCTNSYMLGWGIVDDSVYPGGTFVYQNNGGDESQWTTTAWTVTYGNDLAFKVYFNP